MWQIAIKFVEYLLMKHV